MSNMNGAWGTEERPMDTVTANEVEKLCTEMFGMRAKIKELEKQVEEQKGLLEDKKRQMYAYLTHFKRTSFQSPCGTMYLKKNLSAQVPKDPERKAAFFAWLKERGIFEHYATVNHQSLNALVKEEFEAKAAEGLDCQIPGIGEIKVYETLSMR